MTTQLIYTLLLLHIVICITYVRTEPCDIIENMSCLCHSSFNSENEQLICHNQLNDRINSSIKLTDKVREKIRSFDSIHLTFYDQEMNINAMFINELSYLFPRSPPLSSSLLLHQGKQKTKLSITLSFPYFLQLNFDDYSFYQLFPEQSDYTTSLTLELTSNGQITFSSMALNQLTVDQLFFHSSSLEPYSFEEVFNNTNIGELHIEGFTPRSNHSYTTNFNGKIRLGKFTKMVETISSEEFPDYPVRSLVIEAHEARRINASSFINYRNLHGLHLIRPKFFFDNRSFDGFQYLTNLETIELDAETIKDHTFQHASRIRFFTLGQNVRHLAEHSLDHLDYLTRFDASKIILDQLYPTSRCVLARYIKKQQKMKPSMIILPPQAEYCDCIYDFILTILNQKVDQSYTDLCSDNQQERCQLNECNVVKNFRIPIRPQQPAHIPSLDESIIDNSMNNDLVTSHPLPSYVHRHSSDKHKIDSSNGNSQDSQISALKANTPLDPNAIPIDEYDENIKSTSPVRNLPDEARILALKNEGLKWIALSLVCITILCLLLVITLIWLFTCRRSKHSNKGGFQPIPNSSNV